MSTNDPLAACLSKINNAGKVSKREVEVGGISKLKKHVLEIMKREGYLTEINYDEDRRGGKINITLKGAINQCGVIKPRFRVAIPDIEKYEKRYLPAKGFGFLVISTSKGLMTNEEAKAQNIGGRLIAYCY